MLIRLSRWRHESVKRLKSPATRLFVHKFSPTTNKSSKLCITSTFAWNPGGLTGKRVSNVTKDLLPYHNIIIFPCHKLSQCISSYRLGYTPGPKIYSNWPHCEFTSIHYESNLNTPWNFISEYLCHTMTNLARELWWLNLRIFNISNAGSVHILAPNSVITVPGEVLHYDDVIMGAIASLITSLTIVYSTVFSDAAQRKHQSSASLAFVWGSHRGPVNSPHKWPVTRKMFPFDNVIMLQLIMIEYRQAVCWS